MKNKKFEFKVDYPNKKVYCYSTTAYGLNFEGQAKCSPNDEFDANKGKTIARLRAQKKQLQFILNKVDQDMEKQFQILNSQTKRMEKIKSQLLKIDEELKEM